MDNAEMDDVKTVSLIDQDGHSLVCYVEHSMAAKGNEYVLLRPVDSPIEIFAWTEEEDDDAEMLLDVDESELDDIFPTAKAVLAEQELSLYRTSLALLATGELPDVEDDDIITLDIEDEAGQLNLEQFQQLATFFHEEQEYVICTSLDPLLFLARMNKAGQPELVSHEELQALQSLDEFKQMQLELESQADELDDLDDEELN